MGAPKNMICRPKVADPNPVGNCAITLEPRYVDENGHIHLVADGDELNKGCGNLELTVQQTQTYRLYGMDKLGKKPSGFGQGTGGGYCPIAFDANGNLNYVQMVVSLFIRFRLQKQFR